MDVLQADTPYMNYTFEYPAMGTIPMWSNIEMIAETTSRN